MALRPPEPPLRHGELTLRPWHVTDIRELTRACGDPEIVRWTPVPAGYDDTHAAAYVARSDEMWATGAGAAFAIVGTATGELLGAIELRRPSVCRGTIGFWVAPAARREGVATRALRLVADWAMASAGVRRLELATDPRNEASHRVALRAGFAREGIRRRVLKLRGERRDSVLFARVSEAL